MTDSPAPATSVPQPVAPASSPPPPSAPAPEETKKSPLSRRVLLLVGLIVLAAVGGVLYMVSNQNPPETPAPVTQIESAPEPLTLTLESPTDGTVIESNMLTIKGKTSPNIAVAFYSDTAEGSVESDAQGMFEGMLTLEEGINTVTVTAYGSDGEEQSLAIDVVYDTSEGSEKE